MLILASQSPRREALLRAAGVRFRIEIPEEEDRPPARTTHFPALAKSLALRKAASVAARTSGLVLGADTIVVCDREVLGKPASMAEARGMLQLLSGKWHAVYTGVALLSGARRLVDYERTAVRFRELTEADIRRYLATGEPIDKAGAYAIQGEGAVLIASVRGCYTNVIGLPIPKVLTMLETFRE